MVKSPDSPYGGEVDQFKYYAADAIRQDKIAAHHYAVVKRYVTNQNRSAHYFPKEFARLMASMNKNIPIDLMPSSFESYFHVPPGTFVVGRGDVMGFYVYVGNNFGRVEMGGAEYSGPVVSISICYTDWSISKFLSKLAALSPSDLHKSVEYNDGPLQRETDPEMLKKEREDMAKMVAFVVNSCLYIHSQDTDLRYLKPEKLLRRKEAAEQLEKYGVSNHTSIPVTLVSWDYNKKREYGVDSTVVREHPRWQRCGIGFSDIKLVWVKEHERNYNKVVPAYEESCVSSI